MINSAASLPIGTAIKLTFGPPDGTKRLRILRKVTPGTFTGWNDAAAFVVYDGIGDVAAIDFTSLVNGQTYYYTEFDYDGVAWSGGVPVVSAVPASTYRDESEDTLLLLRSRLEDGLRAIVAAGGLKHETGHIPVFSAPPLYDNVKWPVVSVHVSDESSRGVRAIGEEIASEFFDPDTGQFQDAEGWLASVQIAVIGWTLNPDVRIALRKAIRTVVIGNLPVFAGAGIQQVDFSQSDQEDYESYNSPVYQTVGRFSCLTPALISYPDGGLVADVTVHANADNED